MNEERFKYNTQQGDQGLVANPVKGSRELQHNQFALGDIIEGRYQVVSVIGQGGCGCVYQVHQMLLNKQFALKTLNPVHANEVTIMRLQKEGHAASRLEHRNLVRAIDFGMIHGVQPFFCDGANQGSYVCRLFERARKTISGGSVGNIHSNCSGTSLCP